MINPLARIDAYVKNLINHPTLKVIGAETGIIIQVFNEIKTVVATIVILVTLDLLFGLIAAYKYGCISSWKLRESMHKLLFYIFVIVLGAIINVMWSVPYISQAFIGLIITTELLSIIENVKISFPSFLSIDVLDKYCAINNKKRILKKHAKH